MSVKFEVTLKDLRKAGACFDGYNKVVRRLQGREFSGEDTYRESYISFRHESPIELKEILRTNGLDDALWALRCVKGVDRDARMFAIWCARQVQHLMEDQRSIDALDVAEKFADGESSDEELEAARGAAFAAAMDAAFAAAMDATWAATRDAAWAATWAATRGVTKVAAMGAAWAAACAAAMEADREDQEKMFIEMCEGRAPWQKGGAK